MIEAAAGGDFAYFQGCDPGVSFLAEYNPDRDMICVLVSNYGDDVWKEMRKIRTELYPGTELDRRSFRLRKRTYRLVAKGGIPVYNEWQKEDGRCRR